MSIRTTICRAACAAALAAALVPFEPPTPVAAASAVQLDAHALVGGRYEIGGWLAVSVTLVNTAAPTEGYLYAETSAGRVRRFVDLPAGARKVVSLYIQPEPFQRDVDLSYEEANGTVTTRVTIEALDPSSSQLAVVGDASATLLPQLLAAAPAAPEPLRLEVGDVPERPEPLSGLSGIVFAGDSSRLSEAQRRSIERWVGDGGQLVVMGGADWQAHTASFADLLPLDALEARDGVELDGLAGFAGGSANALQPSTVATGSLRDDARDLVTADDGSVLAAFRDLGAGRVIFVGADMATDAFRGWDGSPALWSRLLPSAAALDEFFGINNKEQLRSSMQNAVGTIPTLAVPPVELLLVVVLGYIVLIGPASYVVLRRMDRREMAWITAPLLIVLFSAGSYGIGRVMKGANVVVNEIAVVRTSSAGSATVETYAGIFSPDRSSYDLTVDADALIGSLNMPDGSFGGRQPENTGIAIDQGEPAHMSGLSIGVFDFQAVSASGISDYEPSLQVTWHSDGDSTVGTVTNMGDDTLSDVAYIDGSIGKRIGELAPGASADFTIPRVNFNGSAASEQIYGFGGFGTGTEEERRTQLRRSVIDALVGYNGFEFAGTASAGPYVIGWRDGAGPMPIEVDGVPNAQLLQTAVEVVSVRPTIGGGQVTVHPLQMAVGVSEIDGDVSVSGGSASIRDGSVTFSVALPLEATRLAATDARVVIAPDPGSLASDQNSFVGIWPEGLTVEVRDVASGDWINLGDLALASTFDVDPEATLSAQGQMQVKVSGTIDPNQFESAPIFISARISGVIGE